MAIKDLLLKVIGQMTDESLNGQKTLLQEALGEVNALLDSQMELRSDSKLYKSKLREAEAKANELAEQLETLKTNTPDVTAYKQKAEQYDMLISEQTAAKKATWAKKAEVFQVKETDKLFEKVKLIKDKFRHAPEGKELADADIDFNLALFDTLETAGHFAIADESKPGFGKPAPVNNQAGLKTSGQALFTNKLS